jgi:hypothetical protein
LLISFGFELPSLNDFSSLKPFYVSGKYFLNDFLFFSQLFKVGNILAKQKIAGIRKIQPGIKGRSIPAKPIIRKTEPAIK